jgi:hypothetical protein
MPNNEHSTESDWHVDPKAGELIGSDDASVLTKKWFDKAGLKVGGKPVRRGHRRLPALRRSR